MNLDNDFKGHGTANLANWMDQLAPEAKEKVALMIQDAWRDLKKRPAGPARARFIYEKVDKEIEETFSEEGVKVSCRKYCIHCCYHEVMISDDEGQLLAEKAIEILNPSEITKLIEQSKWEQGIEGWESHKKREKRCAFLDIETKKCRIYKDRPASCRKYFVQSPPELCAIKNGRNITLTVNKTEILVSAAFNLTGGIGSIPKMTAKHLKRKEEK